MKSDKLIIINKTLAIKRDRGLSEKKFFYAPCQYCGEWISNAGRAYVSHNEKHVRNGDSLKH